MKYLLLFLTFFISVVSFAQRPKAYHIFDSSGNSISWKQMTRELQQQDLVLFGELHNNAIAHWLQLELTMKMHDLVNSQIKIGAEMFEADNQLLIDEYFKGLIVQKSFEDEARLWKNYKTDYKPILEFARKNNVEFIATNVPRRYASLVHRGGFDSLTFLTDHAKQWLPHLPIPFDIELPTYAKMLKMKQHMHGKKEIKKNLVKAQAIKDATMAHFITQNLEKGFLMLHLNGRYHSDNYGGIVWYMQQYAPEARIKTISVVLHDDVSKMDKQHQGRADYIIVVDEDVTKTY